MTAGLPALRARVTWPRLLQEVFSSLTATRRLLEARQLRPFMLLHPKALPDFEGLPTHEPNCGAPRLPGTPACRRAGVRCPAAASRPVSAPHTRARRSTAARSPPLPCVPCFTQQWPLRRAIPSSRCTAVVVGLAKEAFTYENLNAAARILLNDPGK